MVCATAPRAHSGSILGDLGSHGIARRRESGNRVDWASHSIDSGGRYALVYALAPFAIAMLYAYRRREMVDEFLFVFAVGVLLCYAQFPFWPSDPPRVVFLDQDIPSYATPFRRFNLWMLGNYGIHTSVFPSAHVAGAFAAAFGAFRALPERRWLSRFLFVIASLIAIATVYGRYHYLADALAGLLVALVAMGFRRLLSETGGELHIADVHAVAAGSTAFPLISS